MVAPVAVGADPDLEQRRLVLLDRQVAGRRERLDPGPRPDEREAERELDLARSSPCPRRGRSRSTSRRPRTPSSRAAGAARQCSIAAAAISFARRMRSSSWPVLIALARASSGVASATSVPKAWNQSCVKVVGSPTIRSEACVPRLSSSPIVPKSRGGRGGELGRARERRARVVLGVAAQEADVLSSTPCARRPRPRPRGRRAWARPRAGRRPPRSPSCPRSCSGRGRCRAPARRARRAPPRPSARGRARASPRPAASSRPNRHALVTPPAQTRADFTASVSAEGGGLHAPPKGWGYGFSRARHQLTRGGAGSPCASCHETTGLRRTPMRSISASITSPGFR